MPIPGGTPLAPIAAALIANPAGAAAWTALGSRLRRKGAPSVTAVALRCHERALAVDPCHADALFNRANALSACERHVSARDSYRRSLVIGPDRAERWLNLAGSDQLLERKRDASRNLRRALRLAPQLPHAWANLADRSPPAAAQHHRRAAELISPDDVALLLKLANDASDAREIDDALRLYRHAFRVDETPRSDMSNYLITLLYAGDVDGAALAREHRRIGRLIEAPFIGRHAPHAKPVDPDRRLRLGVIAPTFRSHVASASLLPVLEALDRRALELHLFAHLRCPDRVSDRFRGIAAGWYRIEALDDAAAAAAIRAAGIDILIHPFGHWPEARVAVLARKPAPLQVAYMMNAPTMGLRTVDAILVDSLLDPAGELGRLSVERPIVLGGIHALSMRDEELPIDPQPPCLRRGYPTFGSFNDPGKISDRSLALWSRVLAELPSARLVVKGGGLGRSENAARLRTRAAAAGADPTRIDCRGPSPTVRDHLRLIGDMDVMLDTVPFPGGATTVDTLWMGVPVVAVAGDHPMRRLGVAQLASVGASELIAHNGEDYVAIACHLARRPDRLADYRRTLRTRLRASPVMDVTRHAREVEAALRGLWRDWCAAAGRT